MAESKGARNYAIDLIRVIAAFLMTTWHWLMFSMFLSLPAKIDNGYWGTYLVTEMHDIASTLGIENWHWFKGTFTMGFFIFVTGYFMMDGFKRAQAKGTFDNPNTHFMHTWRFTAKTYCSYAPLVLFGTTFGWVLTNAAAKARIADWINTFVWNIFNFLGFQAFGIFQDNATAYVTAFDGPLWYIEAFIVGACIFYAILVRSERLAVFGFCPIMFMLSNVWLNNWLDLNTGAQINSGITLLLPRDFVRLWGPLALGIWGWYLANAIKNANLTKGQEKAIGISWLIVLAYALITSWTGYMGGMIHQDIVWMYVALVAIIQKDPVTRGLNSFLQKLHISKLFADFSAGLYLVHLPICAAFEFTLVGIFGWQNASYVYIGLCFLGAVLFMILNKLVLKPLYGKLAKVLHARDAVVAPAYVSN